MVKLMCFSMVCVMKSGGLIMCVCVFPLVISEGS